MLSVSQYVRVSVLRLRGPLSNQHIRSALHYEPILRRRISQLRSTGATAVGDAAGGTN